MQKRLVFFSTKKTAFCKKKKLKGCVEQITAKQLCEGMDHLPIGCLKTIRLKSPSLPSYENLNQRKAARLSSCMPMKVCSCCCSYANVLDPSSKIAKHLLSTGKVWDQ